MNIYLTMKTLHILSSVLLVGTGFGTAFYLFFANRSNSVEAMSVVSRLVCRADWWFTTPAAIFQPLSGLWLAHAAGFPLSAPWLVASMALYVIAGACWLPVVWLQLRMARMAAEAAVKREPVPARYWRYARRWELLGYPAFVAMVIVYFLMVTKPALEFGTRNIRAEAMPVINLSRIDLTTAPEGIAAQPSPATPSSILPALRCAPGTPASAI